MMNRSFSQGFTLIEIIVVVVIVSVITVLGVQMISSGSVERNLQQHGRILQSALEFSCDQAILQNRSYGVSFFDRGYQFSLYNEEQWVVVLDSTDYAYKKFEDGSLLSLRIDDQQVLLKDEPEEVPQVICNASGELNTFSVLISDASEQHHYQLKTIDFWQIQGQWLNEK